MNKKRIWPADAPHLAETFHNGNGATRRSLHIGKQVVPIVPDESRTFGMEGLFRSVGIYNPLGQHYTP